MSSYARGHSTAWEQRQLGDIAERVARRNSNNECTRVLTASAESGLVDQQEYFLKRIASPDLTNYYLLRRGDFAYNHSSSANAPFGIVRRLDTYDSGCLSSLYIVFRPFSDVDSDFLLQYFESSAWHNDVSGMVTEGARNHGLLNISSDAFFTTHCTSPHIPEQRLIGEFFSTLDSLIAAAERQETLLRQKKQAYLQLIFPCEGETQPRLRFAGFSGDWEQRQLGEVAEVIGGGTPDSSNPQYWDGDIDWYTPSEIGGHRYLDESVRKITHEGLNNSSAKLLPKGSILFTSRASIGLMAFIRRPSSTNQGFQSLVPSKLVDPDFLFAFGPFITRYAKTHAAGSTFVEISGKSLGKTPLALPTIPEQRLIGQFFKTLDSLIAAAEKRTKHLHALKGSYLQRMFV